jgi:sporulation protein YlmC with PRC-barrel domain
LLIRAWVPNGIRLLPNGETTFDAVNGRVSPHGEAAIADIACLMLFKTTTLQSYQLDSLDGEIGKFREFYFDDRHWTIRYLVADTGGWLTGRQVLISPYSLVAALKKEHHIAIDLTKKQIEESPALNSDMSVSRQFELEYHGYYGWPSYWGGPSTWGLSDTPVYDPDLLGTPFQDEMETGDIHLRSTEEVTGYHIMATDGEIGHVDDFIIDDETWTIRYLVVDTRNWWPGKKVLVSPNWIERVSWGENKVFVKVSRDAIKAAPEYTEEALITRDYESGLFQHYGSDGYWAHQTEPLTSK